MSKSISFALVVSVMCATSALVAAQSAAPLPPTQKSRIHNGVLDGPAEEKHSTSAQTEAQANLHSPRWPLEPSSFFGVRFGAPLVDSLPECEMEVLYGATQYKFEPDGRPCFKKTSAFPKLDRIPGFFEIIVSEVDGKVESINAAAKDSNAAATYEALLQRFGPPTFTAIEQVRSKAGVPYSNHVSTWSGQHVTMVFESVGYRVDECSLHIYTEVYAAKLDAEKKSTTKVLSGVFD